MKDLKMYDDVIKYIVKKSGGFRDDYNKGFSVDLVTMKICG